ncbi:hypothetical protein BH23CHL2_BH23CHL2_05900 [soil metagenome]
MNDSNGEPIVPRKAPDRPLEPWIDYDDDADTLIIYFFGPPEPAVSYRLPDDKHLYLRLSEDTYEIIGVQIEGFTHGYLTEHPEFMDLAREVGVSPETISSIERGLDESTAGHRRRRSYARFLMAEIEDQDLIPAD